MWLGRLHTEAVRNAGQDASRGLDKCSSAGGRGRGFASLGRLQAHSEGPRGASLGPCAGVPSSPAHRQPGSLGERTQPGWQISWGRAACVQLAADSTSPMPGPVAFPAPWGSLENRGWGGIFPEDAASTAAMPGPPTPVVVHRAGRGNHCKSPLWRWACSSVQAAEPLRSLWTWRGPGGHPMGQWAQGGCHC